MDARPCSVSSKQPLSWTRADWSAYISDKAHKPCHVAPLMRRTHGGAWDNDGDSVPLALRQAYERDFADRPQVLEPLTHTVAEDGTVKWSLRTQDKKSIECVYIPSPRRATICLSSQVGCAYACGFCATGRMGLDRHLRVEEIMAQLHWVKQYCQQKGYQPISNVVFMGMGEPLANLTAVAQSIAVMTDPAALALAPKRITVSTVGLADRIEKLAQLAPVNLAISLHAPNDSLRNQLMPINRRYPLKSLMAACQSWSRKRGGQAIQFEYLLLDSVNDAPSQARELAELLLGCGFKAKVNLLPFNPVEGLAYQSPPLSRIADFKRILQEADLVTTVRRARGQDIFGACGQLANTASVQHRALTFKRPLPPSASAKSVPI